MSATDSQSKSKGRRDVEAWIELDKIEFVDNDGTLELRLPISKEQSVTVTLMLLDNVALLMVFFDFDLPEDRVLDASVVSCAINSQMPYGAFEVDPFINFAYYRDYVYATKGGYGIDSLRMAFVSTKYALSQFHTIIRAVAEGLIDRDAALRKVQERSAAATAADEEDA